ncbi:Wzz/FepE/Etk N-terminal domain-containing protein [Corallincola spongiicola]|uniref:LPS O-antigen length regulator n=1 Tax=Corallincola spongiicola TaxID=2520508 RepID=A0ABY1WKB6_9GAMM|nr:Wzz/FepE/Etk N-terminal domain-containing protein [Corallincola spongiicola]TAA39605.1 LPS O-antigen length regulator [Corallincola spongiicola]
MPMPYMQQPADDEIDLRELWNVIWRGKLLIIVITAIFAIGAVAFAISKPNIYKADALLAPAESAGGAGGLRALAGQFGGLASLAGVNLGVGGGEDKTGLAIEVLKSRAFIQSFIERHDLLVPLMAAKSWDRLSGELSIDPEIYDIQTQTWLRQVEPPQIPQPSAWQAFQTFSSILSVQQDKVTSFVTISVEHLSPTVAKQWVDLLIKDINQHLKTLETDEAKRSIAYLETQLEKTSVADMQTVFYQLIEEQTKTVMLAEVREEYVFKTVDPAVVPEQKAKPKRALICVLGTILGGMLGVMVVLIRHFARSDKAEEDAGVEQSLSTRSNVKA